MVTKKHILLLLLFAPALLFAQLETRFVGSVTFDNFTSTGGGNYRGDLQDFTDSYNIGDDLKSLQTGYKILDGKGDVYEITTIHSSTSFSADVTVSEEVASSNEPSGAGQVYSETAQGFVPPAAVGFNFSSTRKGQVDVHNIVLLDSLIQATAQGDSIVQVRYVNDTLSIDMESGQAWSVRLGIDSLHSEQNDSIAVLRGDINSKVDSIVAGNRILVSKANGIYTISTDGTEIGTDDQTAGEVWYNDSYLPLNVNDVQQAIDSLKENVDAIGAGASDGVATAGTLDTGNDEIDVTVASPGSNFSISLTNIGNLSDFSAWDKDESNDFSGVYTDLDFTATTGLSDGVDDVDDADASASNEGDLSVSAGGANTATISSNTTGSTDVTIEGSTNVSVSENTGTNTIFISSTDSDTQLSDEQVEDIAGAMFSGNTETLITATYQDADGTIDLEVDDDLSNYDNSTSGFLTSEVDGSITNEGFLSVGAGLPTTSLIQSNTSGSNDITLIAGADIDLTEDIGTNEITISSTGTDDQTALEVSYSPTGGPILSTDVQSAITSIEAHVYPTVIDVVGTSFNITVPSGSTNRFPIFSIDMAAVNTTGNVNFTHSSSLGSAHIRYHFTQTSGNSYNLNFPDNFLKVDSTLWDGGTTYTVENDFIMYCYYDGTDFFCEEINGGNTPSSGSGGAFSTTANVTSNAPGVVTTDDFVFGSTSLDDTGSSLRDKRLLFDKSKGSLYANEYQSTQADDVNRGANATNFSRNSITSAYTSGAYSGQGNDISGVGAASVGCTDCDVDGDYSIAMGIDAKTDKRNQFSQGNASFDASTPGQSQFLRLVAQGSGTNTDTFTVTIDGISTERLTIPDNTLWNADWKCALLVSTAGGTVELGDHKASYGDLYAKNIGGTVELDYFTSGGSNIFIDADNDMLNAGVHITADNTNNAMRVQVIPSPNAGASTVTRCTCTFEITQTRY